MATTSTRLTYNDLMAIPTEREGDRHELIDGELIVTPSPAPIHQIVSRNLFRLLDRHVEAGDLGSVLYAPLDIRFTRHDVLIPDIIFIARDRLQIIGDVAIVAPPDLVVEILSPGTRRRDLKIKRALYARFGVQEFWIVDPYERSVQVLTRAGDAYEAIPLAEDRTIRSRVLPHIHMTLAMIFAEM